VLVEIDGAAERLVDARSTRRLVPLEVSDVALPQADGARGRSVLFFRVLGREGGLRVELWERGEFHGARTLSGAGENPQLVARRVALAAAELGRRLARKREAALARDERLRESRIARQHELQQRTQDGPIALRAELSVALSPGKLALFGQRVTAERSLYRQLRLDIGGELWGGTLDPALISELQGVSVGPGYRAPLTRLLDLDLGASASAFLLQVPAASSLDGIQRQDTSWTARLAVAARLQLRLSRQVRGLLGVEGGALLRSVSYATATGPDRLSGSWWSVNLGIVVTPPG
jgi:hypothetical protein